LDADADTVRADALEGVAVRLDQPADGVTAPDYTWADDGHRLGAGDVPQRLGLVGPACLLGARALGDVHRGRGGVGVDQDVLGRRGEDADLLCARGHLGRVVSVLDGPEVRCRHGQIRVDG